MNLRTAHRISGTTLGVFIVVHLLNHLTLLDSFQRHIQTMKALRVVYRFPLVEGLLFIVIAFQIYSGIKFAVVRMRQKKDAWRWAQLISGIYLAYFFINHVGATLFARNVLGLDTNIYFASVGMHVPPFQYFFFPYYFLAVSAFFIHVACFVHARDVRGATNSHPWLPRLLIATGPLITVLILAAQAGVFYRVTIPDEYRIAFEKIVR